MELKKFKKNKTYKKTLLALGIAGMCLGGGIILSKSYALYETKKEYNVIKGAVQNFNYDVKLAVTVDDEVQTNIPEADSQDNEGNYYQVGISCDNDIKGEWDYNAWTLKLDNVINGTKCRLTFTSTMSQTERDNIIKQGVQTRRNTYRGKDITELWKSGELYKQIESGKFDDIYVGDYIVSENTDESGKKIVWLIADLDNYWNQGDTPLTTHHATIIPAYKLQDAKMNTEATTAGGYAGSEMIKTLDETILPKYIAPDFTKDGKSHILEYQNLLSNTVDDTRSNQFVLSDGVSSRWEWVDRKLDLMSEVNVYGTIIASSSMYDIGLDNRQYAIFQLRPDLINQDLDGNRYWYWFKAVTNSTNFALVTNRGSVHGGYNASVSGGVRPRFLID